MTPSLAASFKLPTATETLNLYVLEDPVEIKASIENYGRCQVLFERTVDMIGILDQQRDGKKAWILHDVPT